MRRAHLYAQLLDLHGGDPFGHVIAAAEAHRPLHRTAAGPICGLYPAGPHVMRLAASAVRMSRARRILDLGTGFGYSAMWLAEAAGPDARVDAIDQFAEHLTVARDFSSQAGLAERIVFIRGAVSEVVQTLEGPYDLIHDDAWFGAVPDYFERVVDVLAPGGVLTMPSWFLLVDALAGVRHERWARFAGPSWEQATRAYAEQLSRDPRLHVTWTTSPPLGIAVKRAQP